MVNQTVEEEVANPYNAKKSWDNETQVERGLVSADDSLFYQTPSKTKAEESDTEDPAEVEATSVEQEDDAPKEDVNRYQKTDYKKRYDDLKRHYDRKVSEFKSEKQRLIDQAREARPSYTPPKTPEELATFREEYSDVYDVAETIAHQMAEKQFKELKEEVDSLKKTAKKNEHEKALAQIKVRHSDFEEITQSDKFHEWASEQPQEIQDWIFRNGTNASLAIRALDLFKRDTGWKTEKEPQKKTESKQKMPSAADAVSVKAKTEPKTTDKKIWTESEIKALSITQYEKHSEEIDEAYMEGRVVRG